MLYELMKWLKYCMKMKYIVIFIIIWLFYVVLKMKYDYYEINEIDYCKFCFYVYILRILWGLCFNECESFLIDYLYSVCVCGDDCMNVVLFVIFWFFNFK